MDVLKYLRELHEERTRIDRVIVQMESLLAGDSRSSPKPVRPSRRGRKPGMTDAERHAISTRMRKYWAAKRGRGADAASSS
jgi:hypothetical protein